MMKVNWKGVLPAITTPFNADMSVDYRFLAEHGRWMVDEGCLGLVPLGSLGEGATLTPAEKRKVLETCVETLAGRAPLVARISALATSAPLALGRHTPSHRCS